MDVLVTGTKGKLVTYFHDYIGMNKYDWNFKFISLRGEDWKKVDFSIFDTIIHCAGITSAPDDDYEEFYRVNVRKTMDLFVEAVRQKTKQFIYLSSMAVYDGIGWGFGKEGLITGNTKPRQKSNYGRSKFEAEEAIRGEDHGCTKVAIIRAPSIVGGGLEAYFDRYIQFSKIPFLPIPILHLEAKRSFIYIDTLIEFLLSIVERRLDGLFFPQNLPLLSVSEMLCEVCKARRIEKGLWKSAGVFVPQAIQKKYFSQICYDKSLSLEENMMVDSITSQEAIRRTV